MGIGRRKKVQGGKRGEEREENLDVDGVGRRVVFVTASTSRSLGRLLVRAVTNFLGQRQATWGRLEERVAWRKVAKILWKSTGNIACRSAVGVVQVSSTQFLHKCSVVVLNRFA